MIACILSGMSATMSCVSCDNICMLCCELIIAGMLLTGVAWGIITAVEWQFIVMCDFSFDLFATNYFHFPLHIAESIVTTLRLSAAEGDKKHESSGILIVFVEQNFNFMYVTSTRLNRIDSMLQFTVSRILIHNMPGFWLHIKGFIIRRKTRPTRSRNCRSDEQPVNLAVKDLLTVSWLVGDLHNDTWHVNAIRFCNRIGWVKLETVASAKAKYSTSSDWFCRVAYYSQMLMLAYVAFNGCLA